VRVSSRPRAGVARGASLDPSPNRAGKALTPVRSAGVRPASGSAALRARAAAAPGARRTRVPGAGYLLAALGLAALFLLLRLVVHHSGPQAAATPKSTPTAGPNQTRLWIDPQYVGNFQTQLASYLAGLAGTYAVAVVDVQTGATIGQNQDVTLTAASVNKLELVVELYRLAEQGQLNLDSTTVIAADEIQNYGTGTIQLKGAGQVYSWRDLATLMIEESDNTAAYVIGNRLGLGNVQNDIQGWGLTHTSITDNTTTARDTATLLQKLANHTLLPAAASEELIGYLENTAWTDRIESGVPEGVPVAHKIGTDVGVFNDAGIVYNGNHPYVLAVLGDGAGENDGLQAITAISKDVWQFEQGLPAATH